MASAQPIPIASTSKAATRPHAASPAHVASLIGSFTRFSLGMSPGMSDAAFKTMVGSSIEQEHGSLIKSLRGVDADFLSEDMCRDYTCCGLTLKDLHALVEHFEEAHVVVLEPVVPPQHAFSSGGFDLADDMELDEPSPVASTSSTPFPPGPSSVLAHRGWHPNTPAFAPYPPPGRDALRRFREYSSDASECIVPELLFSPSATPSPAGSRDGSPDPSNPRGDTSSSKPGTPFQQRVFATRGSMGVIQATDLPPPRPKPFRCPKPGCAKAYKQANGLKYHLQHGQCNFAPMDPNADELKPYICQAGCGKRFKNMSGLRYHYAHSNHGEQGLAMLDAGTHP